MATVDVDKIRSVAVVAHSGAGKTSLIDAMLHITGANTRLGKVNDGTSMCDYNADEIERKITINTKILHIDHNGHRIYLLDTPGYADFIGEVIVALCACEAAVVLIDAPSGVEVGTERVWELLNQRGLARLIFINKLDKENANFSAALDEVKKRLGKHCLAFQFPVGGEASFKKSIGDDPGHTSDIEQIDTEKITEEPTIQRLLNVKKLGVPLWLWSMIGAGGLLIIWLLSSNIRPPIEPYDVPLN